MPTMDEAQGLRLPEVALVLAVPYDGVVRDRAPFEVVKQFTLCGDYSGPDFTMEVDA